MTTRNDCIMRDAEDPFQLSRKKFHIPEGLIYLNGNSLGLMPLAAKARMSKVVAEEWGHDLITAWNKHGWFHLPRVVGNKLGNLVGGGENNVVVSDNISVNLFKVLTAALALRKGRNTVLSDVGNFPSDLYVVQGLQRLLPDQCSLKTVEPEQLLSAIDERVAVVMVTEVDYRTGRKHDVAAIVNKAHQCGALVVSDLAHSAGVMPVDLLADDVDFAVGCTYKFFNGGPGSPAFLFVNPRHQSKAMPALQGWWGHANPFAFETTFTPAEGVSRFQTGTPAILSLVALDAALDVWEGIDRQALAAKSKALNALFIELVEARCASHGLKLVGPRKMEERGSHVCFHCPQGYAVMQALIATGVVGDFRAPDMIRFGFQPLYNSFSDVHDAVERLAVLLDNREWDRPEFRTQKTVT
jgi:kynureninase